MANTKSAKKMVRKIEARTEVNKARRCGLNVPPCECNEDGILVGEVLVEGADGDLSLTSDFVGGGAGVAVLLKMRALASRIRSTVRRERS